MVPGARIATVVYSHSVPPWLHDKFAARESKCLDSGAIQFRILHNADADTGKAETEFHGVRGLPFEFVCERCLGRHRHT